MRSNGDLIGALAIPDKNRVRVKLDMPQFAVASGQSAVFYSAQSVLGGGVIN